LHKMHTRQTSERLDQLLIGMGLAESPGKAQRLILAGEVRVNGQVASKPGYKFPCDSKIEVAARPRFVGRGGDKLQAAFETFNISVAGLFCLDAGASTGGFTDCMLQHGAAGVYAADVGKGLIHMKLRNDPRVTVMDEINARNLRSSMFQHPVSFATIDVSFISLTRILPAVTQVLVRGGHIVSLIKPQFEADRRDVERGGVVRDQSVRARAVESVRFFGINNLGLAWLGCCESPLKGPAGNVEFLAYWQKKVENRGQESEARDQKTENRGK